MAGWVEVVVLLDSRLLDGWRRKSRVSFFPYFSASLGLFCFLSEKISGDLLLVFFPVGLVVKDLIMNLATISSVGAATLVTGFWLVVDGVTGGTMLDCVVDRGVGVGQVWWRVVHKLGGKVDGRAKEGDGRRRGGILEGGVEDGRHTYSRVV